MMEGYLRLTDKLLCEQRRNLLKLPAMGRWTGHQCVNRGSGPVVVGGVTTTQGARESLVQGEAAIRSFEMTEPVRDEGSRPQGL